MTRSEQLDEAGVLRIESTPQDYQDAIDQHLTDEEVQQLIAIKEKLELHSNQVHVPASAWCV